MKTLNLVVAIIYTVFLSFMIMWSLMDEDIELLLGILFYSMPVVVNWITYSKLK